MKGNLSGGVRKSIHEVVGGCFIAANNASKLNVDVDDGVDYGVDYT